MATKHTRKVVTGAVGVVVVDAYHAEDWSGDALVDWSIDRGDGAKVQTAGRFSVDGTALRTLLKMVAYADVAFLAELEAQARAFKPPAGPEPAEPVADPKSMLARGAAIREMRVNRGLSLRDAAEQVGLTAVVLGEVERGVRDAVDWEHLLRVIGRHPVVDVRPTPKPIAGLRLTHASLNADGSIGLGGTVEQPVAPPEPAMVDLPAWYETQCEACGTTFYRTRSESRTVPADEPALCEGCDAHQRGYEEGMRAGGEMERYELAHLARHAIQVGRTDRDFEHSEFDRLVDHAWRVSGIPRDWHEARHRLGVPGPSTPNTITPDTLHARWSEATGQPFSLDEAIAYHEDEYGEFYLFPERWVLRSATLPGSDTEEFFITRGVW